MTFINLIMHLDNPRNFFVRFVAVLGNKNYYILFYLKITKSLEASTEKNNKF